jgi:SAM-dependent methyltransferase
MAWFSTKSAKRSVNPRRDARFFLHRERFERFVDFSNSKGFEIGAFDLPLVEPDEGRCVFGDYRTTEQLKELAASAPGHNPEFVQPVDYDLRNGYDQVNGPFDWIAAAHVIEHIPDVIGWLRILNRILNPGGYIFLVIPDKRYTFDHHRRVSSITDLMDAHRQKLQRPSYRQVFDHAYYATSVPDADSIWRGAAIPPPPKNFAEASSRAERAEKEYVDSHCSVFTPESFTECFCQLSESGIIPFQVGEVWGTMRGQLDFTAVLRKPS